MLGRMMISGLESGDNRYEIGMLLFRLYIGLAMAFGHGLYKIPPGPEFINGVHALGFPIPVLFGWLAGISEFFAALFVAIGLTTRPAAWLVCGTMAVAAFIRHAADPFAQKELALAYLAGFLLIGFVGAGRVSLDGMLRRRRHVNARTEPSSGSGFEWHTGASN